MGTLYTKVDPSAYLAFGLLTLGLLLLSLLMTPQQALAADVQVPWKTNQAPSETTIEAALPDSTEQTNAAPSPQPGILDNKDSDFILSGLLISGLSAIGPGELLTVYQSMLGKPVSPVELRQLTADIETYYREQGYPNARVVIPRQKITSGLVRMTVFEGSISRARLAGEIEGMESKLEPYLSYFPLNQAASTAQLEHLTRVLSGIPGISASPSIQLIEGSKNQFELVIYIRRRSNKGMVWADNRGSKLLGPLRASANYTFYNPLNTRSQIKLGHLSAPKHNEMQYSTVDTRWALGSRGLELELNGAYGDVEPGDFLKALRPIIRIKQADAKLRYPLSLGYHHGLSIYAGARYYEADVSILGAPLTADQLYTFRTGVSFWNRAPGEYDNALQVDVVHGLQGLSDTLTVSDGVISSREEEQFTLLRLNASHVHYLNDLWQLNLELDGQYASRAVPSAEVYSFGGETLGKAYDPGEIFGDHGIASQITLQRKGLLIPWINADTKVYAFYDIGRVWDEDNSTNFSAASTGIGSKITKNALSLELEINQPLTRPVFLEEHSKNPRLFAKVSYNF